MQAGVYQIYMVRSFCGTQVCLVIQASLFLCYHKNGLGEKILEIEENYITN